MDVAIVVGNPKPASRTLSAARHLAIRLGAFQPHELDLATLGPELLDWASERVSSEIDAICRADLVIFASPTYKATYTGLLKLFLDQIPQIGLEKVTAVPLMLGAAMGHARAAELVLKPVLVELSATCPTRGLYLLDSDVEDSALLESWLGQSVPRSAASRSSAPA